MMIPESDKTQTDAGKIEQPTQESRREFLLAAMRCGRIRAQLLPFEIDEIAVSLKFNMITPELAVEWLQDIDALRFVSLDALEQVPE